ncbi:MAG: GatB/YqeY domain-containing protein [Gammaproteobacteria bacterium]|nr:MAG: GatB/YqeY domain-containing protein [Gammaproteobacteria bacterium]
MKLKTRIQEDMKNAMRSGAQDELKVIRLILSAIKQIEVDSRISIEDDNQVLDILNKMMKQRRDSISQFEQGGRKDLADIENAEIEILTQYLPEQLNESEIDSIVQETIKENGAADITKMGMVMSIVKEKVKGQADMAVVSQKVKASLTK